MAAAPVGSTRGKGRLDDLDVAETRRSSGPIDQAVQVRAKTTKGDCGMPGKERDRLGGGIEGGCIEQCLTEPKKGRDDPLTVGPGSPHPQTERQLNAETLRGQVFGSERCEVAPEEQAETLFGGCRWASHGPSVADGCNSLVDWPRPGRSFAPGQTTDLGSGAVPSQDKAGGWPSTWVRLGPMARSIWTGALGFGLVNVPVALFPATQDRTIHFNQFEAGTSDRIRYKKVNERTGEEVPSADIVKGVSLGEGEYVVLSDEELGAAEPQKSRNIEITDFVDLDEIDPISFRSSYYLAPQGEPARRAYALLRQAMRESNKVAVATLVMRNKEYLVTVRPRDDVLVLETMYFADEVRSPKEELPNVPDDESFTEREFATANLLIDSMTTSWEPEQYHDTHRGEVQRIIEQKRAGEEIVLQAPPPTPKVIDLMAALQASVDAISQEGERGGDSGRRTGTATGGDGSSPTGSGRAGTAKSAPGAPRTSRSRPGRAASVKPSSPKPDAAAPEEAPQRKISRRRAS